MSGSVIRQGYLIKSPSDPRSSVKSWRKRWVVLYESHLLKYFKDEASYQRNGLQKGDINLNDCTSIDLNVNLKYRPRDSIFVIKTYSRNYYFVAESATEMKAWVDSVCRLCNLSPESQGVTGRQSLGSVQQVGAVTDGMMDPDAAPFRKPRSATEPMASYLLLGQLPDDTSNPMSPTMSVPMSQSMTLDRPSSQYYDRLPSPQTAWQTSPADDYRTLQHPSSLQMDYSSSSSPQDQPSWIPDTSIPISRRHSPYDVVPPPRPVASGASTLPSSARGGLLNDRSRPHRRYDHPPGSSATSVYAVPPFSKEELYMVPRRNPEMATMGVPPPPVNRHSKPGEPGLPAGPLVDRSIKPGGQSAPALGAHGGWGSPDGHPVATGTNRRIQYTEVDLLQSPTSPTGPSRARTQYSQIDIAATMRRQQSPEYNQGFYYQDEIDLHHDPFAGGDMRASGQPYMNMQNMVLPEDIGGMEEYIAMQNGVHGDYYTYMRDHGLESDELYAAASGDGGGFSYQEDPYGNGPTWC